MNSLRLNTKAKCLMVFVLIAVVLISVFAFLPKGNTNIDPQNTASPTATPLPSATSQETNRPSSTSSPPGLTNFWHGFVESITNRPPGIVGTAQAMNSTVWLRVAASAWAFYKPGVGVDYNTGLPYAGGVDFPAFTDWDLGSYIQAIINAQKLGLINATGPWGAQERLGTVVSFLENRPLNATTRYPYWFYDAKTGDSYRQISDTSSNIDLADTGRLFVALNNLKAHDRSLSQRIDNIVYNAKSDRTDYSAYVSYFSGYSSYNNLYAYYIVSGFASFWPQQLGHLPSTILSNLLNSPPVDVSGIPLPNAPICNEPLLSSIFETRNGDHDRLMNLASQVYLAHEYRFNETGKYVAPSEGVATDGGWWYEWVVAPNGNPWNISNSDHSSYYLAEPVVYNKVAFGYSSLYNTTYTLNMIIWLEELLPEPSNGYYDGADKDGRVVGRSINTNAMILDAAVYAIKK